MRPALVVLAVVALPAAVSAAGFEIIEQSPAGVGTTGAQTAVAAEASTVYYNPAGLAFVRGFSLVGGTQVVHTAGNARPPGEAAVPFGGTFATPTVHLSQRLGPHFGVGIGVFSNFAQHLEYPGDWSGARWGTFFDLTTTTINPSVALRPFPFLAIGFGLAVVPAAMALRHALPDGGAHAAGRALGLGGNVGLLVRLLPRYLYFGATYRSSVDLDFTGSGGVGVTGTPAAPHEASMALALPHNFSVGFASRPTDHLILSADAHLTLWRDVDRLSVAYVDPGADPSLRPTRIDLELNLRDSVAVRVGGELRALDERVRVRLGLGFDTPPARAAYLNPLTPDSYRVTVAAGLGYHQYGVGVDVGYSAGIVVDRTATNANLRAGYGSVVHLIALALVVQLQTRAGHVNMPDYKR